MIGSRRETAAVDRVTLVGSALALGTLAFGFLQARPSRIAAGTMLPLWRAASPYELALFILLPCVAFAFALAPIARFGRTLGVLGGPVSAVAGALFILLTLIIPGIHASGLRPVDSPYARISFAPGFWIALFAGYVLIAAGVRRMGSGIARFLVVGVVLAAAVGLAASGLFGGLSIAQEWAARKGRFTAELEYHVAISLAATLAAVVIGLPAGVWAHRRPAAGRGIFVVVNTAQTIPSLALFGLLIAPLSALSHRFPVLRSLGVSGVGTAPAFIALTLYALLPIVRNTYVGLQVVDPSAAEAGRGMGMNGRQLLFRVELPLALPVILGGGRTALVQAIGNAAVAALIGAGGFGVFIFQGLGQAAPDLILLGTLPVILLSIVADRLMTAATRLVTPKGMGPSSEGAGEAG